MLTKSNTIGILLLGLGILITPAWAMDYSSMSTEEMAKMRGTNQNLSPEEHAAFQKEWQNRMRKMSQTERQKYLGKPENAPQVPSGSEPGEGKYQGNTDNTGSGYGKMKKNRSEEGYGRNNQGNNSGNSDSREGNRYQKNYRNQNRMPGSGNRSMGKPGSGRGRR